MKKFFCEICCNTHEGNAIPDKCPHCGESADYLTEEIPEGLSLSDEVNQTFKSTATSKKSKQAKICFNKTAIIEIISKSKFESIEDIAKHTDESIKKILKDVDSASLLLCCKAASDSLKEAIFRNMSGFVARSLQEDLENLAPVAISDIKQAQLDLFFLCIKLEQKKELTHLTKDDLPDSTRNLIFNFTDLLLLDDRAIQQVLKEIAANDLLPALKNASEELRNKFFTNISQRASATLREDLEAMPPQRLSDVEKSQQNIIAIVKRLENEGKIAIIDGDQLV